MDYSCISIDTIIHSYNIEHNTTNSIKYSIIIDFESRNGYTEHNMYKFINYCN